MACQSGRSLAGAVLLAGATIPALCSAQAVSWAHQNGSLQSNGSITIKSQSGGSYAGQVNPAGAVAKANQSAVTQPPTVIIQSTGTGHVEAVPLVSASGTPPTCPAGYNATFTVASGAAPASCPVSTFNIAGSRFSLIAFNNGAGHVFSFFVDNELTPTGYPFTSNGMGMPSPYCGMAAGTWSARLCTK